MEEWRREWVIFIVVGGCEGWWGFAGDVKEFDFDRLEGWEDSREGKGDDYERWGTDIWRYLLIFENEEW